MSFPPISADPLEQWLVEEAVMSRYHQELAAVAAHDRKLADAQAEAKRRLVERTA